MAKTSLALAGALSEALIDYNQTHGKAWSFGANFDGTNTELATFWNNNLFPKIRETKDNLQDLGNSFNRWFVEVENVSQLDEDYVIADGVPIDLNLGKPALDRFKSNYRPLITKIYRQGQLKKVKFSINNYDMRLKFNTLIDFSKYALKNYQKAISDINLSEESEVKAMLVDYALTLTQERREVNTLEELIEQTQEGILNVQNNSHKYNESKTASGGELLRYTTVTKLEDVLLLTTDHVKSKLLDTKIAQVFQVAGLDFTDHIISFEDLGGTYRLTDDVTIASADTIKILRLYGDYQTVIGDTLYKGTVFTFDVTELPDFVGHLEEIKPPSDLFMYLFDARKIRLRRDTQDMLQPEQYNPEDGTYDYWLHYYSQKNMSPFYNNILIMQKADPDEPEPQRVEVTNTTPIPTEVQGTVNTTGTITGNVNTTVTNTEANPVFVQVIEQAVQGALAKLGITSAEEQKEENKKPAEEPKKDEKPKGKAKK